mmetsp:Transcript_14344/g.23377  ORF Transcript_14344/g.23377 Transcript_14344/m.23377 type:complete len:203 (+) Transcript_14344:153-761(+)
MVPWIKQNPRSQGAIGRLCTAAWRAQETEERLQLVSKDHKVDAIEFAFVAIVTSVPKGPQLPVSRSPLSSLFANTFALGACWFRPRAIAKSGATRGNYCKDGHKVDLHKHPKGRLLYLHLKNYPLPLIGSRMIGSRMIGGDGDPLAGPQGVFDLQVLVSQSFPRNYTQFQGCRPLLMLTRTRRRRKFMKRKWNVVDKLSSLR